METFTNVQKNKRAYEDIQHLGSTKVALPAWSS